MKKKEMLEDLQPDNTQTCKSVLYSPALYVLLSIT